MQNKDAFLVYGGQGSPSSLERNCLDVIDRFGPSKVSCARKNYIASPIISIPGRSCLLSACVVLLWGETSKTMEEVSKRQVLSMKLNEKTDAFPYLSYAQNTKYIINQNISTYSIRRNMKQLCWREKSTPCSNLSSVGNSTGFCFWGACHTSTHTSTLKDRAEEMRSHNSP